MEVKDYSHTFRTSMTPWTGNTQPISCMNDETILFDLWKMEQSKAVIDTILPFQIRERNNKRVNSSWITLYRRVPHGVATKTHLLRGKELWLTTDYSLTYQASNIVRVVIVRVLCPSEQASAILP